MRRVFLTVVAVVVLLPLQAPKLTLRNIHSLDADFHHNLIIIAGQYLFVTWSPNRHCGGSVSCSVQAKAGHATGSEAPPPSMLSCAESFRGRQRANHVSFLLSTRFAPDGIFNVLSSFDRHDAKQAAKRAPRSQLQNNEVPDGCGAAPTSQSALYIMVSRFAGCVDLPMHPVECEVPPEEEVVFCS